MKDDEITMETIKSYSDLQQSKKLAEILPLETADMHYCLEQRDISSGYEIGITPYTKAKSFTGKCNIIDVQPAWSLAALLSVLPNNENISTNLSKGGYRISTLEYTNSWFVDYEDETDGLNNCVTSADNPVDACYNMIIKLHELNLL